jgi:predicted O-linked N-acetylglucosamine transferase (SPINDLY family)
MRRRLGEAFDAVIDVSGASDQAAAELLRSEGIDIAVDLAGYTEHGRAGILASRPVAVQAAYLGYPGTTAAPFIDYLIADRRVVPELSRPFYSEKIVYLPDTYQVNDRLTEMMTAAPSRQEAGLPAEGFVFCCFNNSYKIRPEVFAVWMRLLRRIDGSVLWLLSDGEECCENLRREAAKRGVRPERLIFAPRLGNNEHLVRHRLAGLFLDTLPYNAHTTASDALRAGLPLITCMGPSFAGRVAGSLLHAVGLPELVTHSLEDYEALAGRLAENPAELARLRNTLIANSATHALFDTDRFRRNIEAAYLEMHRRHRAGEAPTDFAVAPS